jgi:glycosyltransferase involved in cell wall biosynthesis
MGGFTIGLDGRALGNINRTRGIGRYTANLVESLVGSDSEHRFVLFGYGPEPDPGLLSPAILDKVEWREIPRAREIPYLAIAADHALYARAVHQAGVDLFHGIDHNLTPLLRCPSIVTVHDLVLLVLRGPYLGPTSWIWMRAHRRAARRARAVVAVSRNTARDVERIWSIPAERIVVVPEGVSEAYRPVEDKVLREETNARYGVSSPYFLYLGGFDPRKNLHNMLLAFKRFTLAADGGHSMVLCGESGAFEPYLRDEIAELGLEGKVVLAGYVKERDLPALYSGAAAFICVSTYEGFGLPLLEAMACGTPVVASNTSSIPEVVGDAGLLVDPLDPADIMKGMERLARDPGLAEELRAKGMRRASSFTWEGAAARIIRLYEWILEGGEPGSE